MDWNALPDETYDTPETQAAIWVPSSGVIVTRARGVGDLGAVQFYTRRMDLLLVQGRCPRAFHHWAGLTSFRPEAREHLRKWAEARQEQLDEAHYYVGSKLLSMAIAVAALALRRDLVTYSDEAKFEAVLDEAVRNSRREQSDPG